MESLPDVVEKKLSEHYSETEGLRAVIALIPWVGGAIDAIVAGRGAKIAAIRLKASLTELKRQAEQLEEEKVDSDYLDSDEFYDLVCRLAEKGQRTSAQEKVRLYVRVLLRSVQGARYRENAEEYLGLLSDLSMPEVRIASVIYGLQRDIEYDPEKALQDYGQSSKADDIAGVLPDMSHGIVDSYLKRLERTGLVSEVVGSYVGYLGGAYRITGYFRQMMVYLALNDLSQVP